MFKGRGPWWAVRDRWDDQWAKRRRADLAHRRWLVSWQRRDDGQWLARVSSPDLPVTIERARSTRCRAIEAAVKYLAELTTEGP